MVQQSFSHISVRVYDKAFEGERIHESRKARTTEIDAELLSRFGLPIPASDTIGELRAKGFKRCARCGHYKEPAAFSKYKRQGYEAEYLQTYCKECRAEMIRTKRWSNVTPMQVYPTRIDQL